MKSPLLTGNPSARNRAAVLVIVLGFLVFLSLIIVSLTLALQMESQAAHYYAARGSADLLAEQGIEFARAALITAEQPTNAWATAPGRIYYWPTNSTPASGVAMDLSSGPTNAAASGVYLPPDLNHLVSAEDSMTAITGESNSAPMNVGWIYVHQSGAQETNQVPAINTVDPIIGRFAYWTDDESSRIDLNTADATAGNTNSLNHPSRIDLSSLLGVNFAQEIYTNALVSSFNSPDDVRRLDPGLSSMISTNRFSLTHYAYSQNLNPWGQPKIILTTKQSLAGIGNTNFLNFLTSPTADPGLVGNCTLSGSTKSVAAEVNLISSYLTNNWPGFGANSFIQKYGASSQTQAANEMALNIIDYVRSVESTNVLCEPIRGNLTSTTLDQSSAGTGSLSGLFGTSRHPLITEVACWIEPTRTFPTTASPAGYRAYVSVELYLPPGYGVSSVSIPGNQVATLVLQEGALSDSVVISSSPPTPTPTTATTLPVAWVSSGAPGGVLSAGNFCVVTVEYNAGGNPASVSFPTNIYPGRVSFKDSGGGLWEVAPVGFNFGTVPGPGLSIIINNVAWSTAPAPGFVLEINDPRVNKNASDWTLESSDVMGSQPIPWLKTVTTTPPVPPQDTISTTSTTPSTNSLYFPAPGGTVQSVADLGYITTGVNLSTNGVPWRSVRLQPTPAAQRTSASVPDWVLLDLFQAPFSTNRPDIYQPETNSADGMISIAGQVNINSGNTPFPGNPNIVRTAPLVALLQNATNLVTASTAGSAATNVGLMTMAANGTNYGAPVFFSPAELAEVQGIADGGEASESNLRGLVDLSTVHGSTFRVFSVGQTLTQTPAGILTIQSEQYKEAIIRQDSLTRHVTVLWKNISE